MKKYSPSIHGLNSMKMAIGILGPGAIGGFLAGLLWKQGHEVLCICRPKAAASIQKKGIHIKSSVFGDFVALPQSYTKLVVPVDVLFIATKAPSLPEALASIAPRLVEKSTVISLLNGVGHREVIRKSLGQRLAVGMIGMIEVAKCADGHICQLSRQNPHVDLASDRDISAVALENIAAVMLEAGVSTSILQSEGEVIWKKLVRLSAIASLTAAFQQTVGTIRSNPECRKLLEDIVREGVLVALHEGVTILPEDVLKQIDALPEGLTTSLQRDVQRKIPSEAECITGGVLRLARLYDIPAPVHENAYALINQHIR